MNKRTRHLTHKRWIGQLGAALPEGVPACEDDSTWPATFGDMSEDGTPLHQPDEGEGYCFQCLHCRHYVPLAGMLGADWGGCTNAASQYDRQLVFEHWTCREYRR